MLPPPLPHWPTWTATASWRWSWARPVQIWTRSLRRCGRAGYCLFVYVGTPFVRSLALDGSSGALIWEKTNIPGLDRYYAPTVNLAAVWDVNGDGKEDMVFTCPDYYCVASGPTGEPLVGPALPRDIFKQPSQGLYTLPAILP